MLFKPILALSLAVLAKGVMAQSAFPPPAQGDISMIQNPSGNGDTRIYYQQSSGDILQLLVSGPFDVGGHVYAPWQIIVPSAEVLPGTPITTAVLGTNTWNEESIPSLTLCINE
ncbi:hypothetical protein C0992_013343 [Termitomyces sp. T32_za158]|nr:hypothetical protein C0992_013343 [Termitomyces sp. T32_za158]